MDSLEKLRKAGGLADLAELLGFTPRGVSFIIYKMDAAKKYRSFGIPKKSGGTRTIHAPAPQLALLQRRLAKLLYACVCERKAIYPRFWFASHGFHKSRTIISNAELHRRRRFVFNIDLEDFFGTINFGRVRGYFIHDNCFALNPDVATIIAQIACHDNHLPQGSPCSPVISNLIGNILDSRLLALARDSRCMYSRYADDLTFSTNEVLFPTEIAVNAHGSQWEIGTQLKDVIAKTGFSANPAKTRMSLRSSRQTVTGLVVNDKVNISQDYYRFARAMCNSLFQRGHYFISHGSHSDLIENLNVLEGILSHIYFVKSRRDRNPSINRLAEEAEEFRPPHAPEELYRRFLFYKYFAAPKTPLIVTEGISDITYIQCAIRALGRKFPLLAEERSGRIVRRVRFLKPSGVSRDILGLGQGAAGQASLIARYESVIRRYSHKPMDHPIIILCDNDDGLKTVVQKVKSKLSKLISTETTDPFYYLGLNLYLVKVPEGTPAADRDIESLFEPAVLKTKLDGKTFSRKKEHKSGTEYGKVAFAEGVVRAGAGTIKFDGFEELLTRISQAIEHYAALTSKLTAPTVAHAATFSTGAAAM